MIWLLVASIICSHPMHDFGKVKVNSLKSHVFELCNQGRKTLRILNVTTSCACTVAKYPKQIAAGKKTGIKVLLDTQGLKGRIERNIIVITDDDESPYIMLKISATVE
jgi:hypothetical protein